MLENNRIEGISQLIYKIFKSEKDKNSIERLYNPGSKQYLDYLKINSLDVFYQDFYDEVCFNHKQTEFLKNLDTNKKEIKQLNEEKENIIKNSLAKSKTDFLYQYDHQIKKIHKQSIRETFINIYYNNQNKSLTDINIKAFQSTLCLFNDLTLISEKISDLKEDQFEVLITELNKLNDNFPSNCYVPFLNESARNYIIVHIPISQVRIFKTKNRAPYLIQFELVRVDEINKAFKASFPKQSVLQSNSNYFFNSKKKSSKKLVSPFNNQTKSNSNDNDSNSDSNKELNYKDTEEEDIKSETEKIDKRSATMSRYGEGLSFDNIVSTKSILYSSNTLKSKNKNHTNENDDLYEFGIKDSTENTTKPVVSVNNIQRTNSCRSDNSSNTNSSKDYNDKYFIDESEIKKIKKNRASTIKLLIESDIKVSKPLTLNKVDKNFDKFLKNGKVIEEQYVEEDSLINNDADEKIDKAIAESLANHKIIIGNVDDIEIKEDYYDIKNNDNYNKNKKAHDEDNENLDNIVSPDSQGKLNNSNFVYPSNEEKPEFDEHRLDSRRESVNSNFSNNNEKDKDNNNKDNVNTYLETNLDTQIGINDTKVNVNSTTMYLDQLKEKPSLKDNINYKIIPVYKNESKDIFGSVEEEASLRHHSPFGNFSTWRTFKCIVKSGEDLRQEQFASQLINLFNQIFKIEKVDCWVNPYEVISTGKEVGIIECVNHSMSLDALKKKMKSSNLKEFFVNYFGGKEDIKASQESKSYQNAINNFIKSLAGNCLVSYFLQIKDRHNGNILLDNKGHLVHIDFGFMFTIAPGKGIQFEKAPFKLTSEFVQVLDGIGSKNFEKFRKLLWKGFIASVKHAERIMILVEMMLFGHGDSLPCFKRKDAVLDELRERFYPFLNDKKIKNPTKTDYFKHVDSLIEASIDNWRTKWYDTYQYYFQGIFY